MPAISTIVAIAVAFVASGHVASAAEFHDDIERDFALRSLGQLQITNLRGGITIQGWALDKIRVKARRKAVANTAEEAKKLFSALDFRFRAENSVIELSAEYGKGLEIQQRLREREQPHTSMEMVVYAPANLDLTVWAIEGSLSVKNWNASVDVRTSRGDVRIENLRSKNASVLCPSCSITAKTIRGGSLRCMGGTGSVDVSDFEGEDVFVETSTGQQSTSRISGEQQLYISRSGKLQGRDLRGRIEFQTQKGAVAFTESAGFISGRTETGDVSVKMRQWEFADKALIESAKGDIALSLPTDFSGEIDLWSVTGKTSSGFTSRAIEGGGTYGPEPVSHIRGRVGDGGEQLKLFSQEGDVRLNRGT